MKQQFRKRDYQMEEEELELVNQVIVKHSYKAVKKISQGSYGQVYAVVWSLDQQLYAMKIIDRKKLCKVFKEHEAVIEGIVLQKMKHPGIVKFKQMIIEEQWIFHVMELCPYGSIFQLLCKISKNMSLAAKKPAIMQYYLCQILETIDYMHTHSIIHRDLKPQNIVIGQDMRIRIVDFGSAKPTQQDYFTSTQKIAIEQSKKVYEEQTRKSFVGSPHYLSPEGTRCQHSTASDIWAFGIIVYKFFHGKHPFEAQNNFAIFKKIKSEELVISQDVPAPIRELMLLCLKKDPKQRPNAKFLKLCTYFKSTNFDKLFTIQPPITPSDLKMEVKASKQSTKMEVILQKRMFFGNFKPRVLTMCVRDNNLFMAYKYVETKVTKNEFQLSMNDYANATSKNEFQFANEQNRYYFRVKQGPSSELVDQINQIIRQHFNLD